MKKYFSIREALSFGYDKFKERPGFFIGLNLLYFVIVGILPRLLIWISGILFPSSDPKDPNIVGLVIVMIISLGSAIYSLVLSIGLLRINLDVVEEKHPEIKQLFQAHGLFFSYLFLSILVGIVTGFGFLLFIIPGIVLSLMLMFSTYALVDERQGLFNAMTRSQEITKSVRTKLFLMGLVSGLLNLGGAFCFGIGVLVTAPITSIATAFVYKKLKEQTDPSRVASPSA